MIVDTGLWVDKQTGETYPRKLIMGKVVRDAELRQVGQNNTSLLKLGVSLGYKEDIVNVKMWGYDAEDNAYIKKNMTVIIDAREETREYNGKTYTDYVAINTMCDGVVSGANAEPKKRSSKKVEPQDPNAGFTDITNPEDLPF